MPTPAEIRAELDRRTKQAPAQPAPVATPTKAAGPVDAIKAELARRGVNGSGMGPVNPMVAEGRAMAAAAAQVNPTMSPVRPEARGDVALRTPTLTLPPQRGPVMSPMQREAMAPERAEADRQRQMSQQRREAAGALGGGMDMLPVTDAAGNVSPGTDVDRDMSKTIIGAPLQLGQGLAEGSANIINNLTGMAAEGVNTANRFLLGDKAVPFSGTNIQVPSNAIVDGDGALSSVGGVVPRIAGQFMAGRVPLGKVLPKGGAGADIAKDALAFAATTDKDTPRLSDMLPAGMMDGLRTREGEGYTEAFMKNALEDSVISSAAAGLLKLAGRVMDGPSPQQAGAPPRGTITPTGAPPASSLTPAERKAIDLVIRKLEADGLTIEDVVKTAAAYGRMGDSGVYETLAEFASMTGKSSGANTRGLAMAGGAVPGPTQQALIGRVQQNADKLPDRLSRAATRATGQNADNAVATLDELEARLKTEAAPRYEEFYAAPVDAKIYDGEIAPVLSAPHGRAAMERAARGLGVEAASLQARVASGADMKPALQRSYDAAESLKKVLDGEKVTLSPLALDHVKRAFDDLIDEAGQGTYTATNLRSAKRNFAESVSRATGGKYGEALGTYENIKRLEEAFDIGLKSLNQKTWQLERALAAGSRGSPFSGGEVEAIAMGVARSIEDMIEAGDQRALTALTKDKALKNIATALGSEQAAKKFEQSIRRLAANREFGRRVAGGSDTAMRQAAIRDAGVEAEDVVTKGLDAVERGNIPFSLQSVADASFRAGARKAKEAYRYFRYPGLYDEDVNKALAPLISEPLTETRRNALAASINARQAERGARRNILPPPGGGAAPKLKAPPSGPRKLPGQTSNASPTATGIVVGGIGGAMADEENPLRGAAIGAAGLGTAVGLGNRLAKGSPKPPKGPPAFDQRFMKEAQRLVSYNGGVDKALKAQQYVIDQLKNSKAPNAQDRLNRAVSIQYAIRRMADRSNRELDEIAATAWKRDPATVGLGTQDYLAYINAKHPPATPNQTPPYFIAASTLKRAGGNRQAAAAELADYAAYLRQSKAAPEVVENADRAAKAVADVDPAFFSDDAFNARMRSEITAGGEAAIAPSRGSTDMLPGERPIRRGPPGVKPPPVKNGFGGKSLPMDEPSRMQRAREQGFDVDTPLYHGTPDSRGVWADGFKTPKEKFGQADPDRVYFFAEDQRTASTYADDRRAFDYQNATAETIPVYLRMQNPKVIQWSGRPFRGREKDGSGFAIRDYIDQARAEGHDGVIIRNVIDTYDGKGKPSTIRAVFDPANIRSVNAKFDPSETQSSKLLAGVSGQPEAIGAGLGTVAGGTLNLTDANGDGVIDDADRMLNAAGGALSLGVMGRGARAIGNRLGGAPKAPPAGKFRGPNSQTFAGINAKTADKAALARAQNMEAEGASRDDIWDATGWFKGVDGKWRFEIDDSGAKLTGAQKGPLGSIMEHPELYKAYPDLANAQTVVGGKGGAYIPPAKYNDEMIQAGANDTRSIALHEAGGHGVQEREGFARGAGGETFTQQKEAELARDAMSWRKEIAAKRKQMPNADWIAVENAVVQDYQKMGAMEWLPSRQARDLARDKISNPDEQLQELINVYQLDKYVSTSTPMTMYRRTAGEVDARNIQTRDAMRMRGEKPGRPWETQDVPDDQQIVRFGGGKAESRPKPPPTGNRAGKPKPPPKGPPGTVSRMVAGGAVGGIAGGMAGEAGGQEDLTSEIANAEGKISLVEQEIAALKKAKADFDKITDPFEKQRFLNSKGLYKGNIDGNIKGLTTDGINAWDAQNAAALAKAEAEKAASKKELDGLKKQDAYRQMQKEQNPFFNAVRELGPSGAMVLAGAAATVLRIRGVGKSKAAVKVIEKDINDLLTNGPVKSLVKKGGAANQSRNRAVNMNEFYRRGGAPDNKLPFNYGPSGWKPNSKAVKPGSLYQPKTTTKMDDVGSQFLRPNDIKLLGVGVLDSVAIMPFVSGAEEELKKAEQDVANGNESIEALRRVEKAKTDLAMYQTIQRIGWGLAGGGALSLGYRYKLPRPDIRGAEDEVTAISDFLKSKAPPRAPRTPKALPPPTPQPPPVVGPSPQLMLPLLPPAPPPKKPKPKPKKP